MARLSTRASRQPESPNFGPLKRRGTKELIMTRPVTLFTGQWTDLPFDTICASAKRFGYDGVEIAAWGGHFDVNQALSEDAYARTRLDTVAQHGLKVWAISNHL